MPENRAKTANTRKNENRRNRIRNRISRRPAANRHRPHPLHRHRKTKRHESQEDQLQTAIDRILSTVTEKLKDARLSERASPPPRAETCKGVIQKLWAENWFSQPRGLDDVHTELARRGFHYDRTAVAHALATSLNLPTTF